MNSITVRPLEPKEWAVFKDFRLQALKAEPGVFHSSYQEELAYTPEKWQRTLADPADLVFGLFDAGHLIGITAVFRWREDPSGETALLGMSFIAPEYRGRGLSRLLYKARLEWIRTKGLFKRVVVSHRASNGASRRAIERHGFLPTRCAARIWPDGITEDEIFYEMRISN
jgi:RimJ/RimL family protein N-acetyltransferase